MANVEAAWRYAEAAFSIAVSQEALPQWRADLADVAEVLTRSQVAGILADSRVPIDRRTAIVERTLDIQPLALNLAKLLVVKGRTTEAAAVAEAFGRMADEREGIAHATITTAVDIGSDQVQRIEQRLSTALGKQVRAQATTDPAILGGVVVRVGDTLIDGSVRTRLRRLRRELEGVR